MYSNYCDYFSFLNLIIILYIILYRNERIVNNCNYNYLNNEEYINNFYRSQEAPHQSTWLSRQQSRDRPATRHLRMRRKIVRSEVGGEASARQR